LSDTEIQEKRRIFQYALIQSGMQTIQRLILTGGGTAGHVNPALAIGSVLATEETRVLFVGVKGRAEEEVVPREGIPIKFVRASGYRGGVSPEALRFLLDLLVGTFQSIFILIRFRPDIIVGTGGYVSAPIITAASFLRKIGLSAARIYLHEQNAAPGKLNRLMGRFADQVFVTFPETLSFFPGNGVLTGYPLRRRIARISHDEARKRIDLEIPAGRKIILVFGGSQGSRSINRALVDALQHFLPYRDEIYIVHGVGLLKTGDYNAIQDTAARLHKLYSEEQLRHIDEFYVYREFFHNIELLYALSSVVVARAGAGSLNEISAMGLPALIIPKSNLPGNHQVMNARAIEGAGGAEILYEQIAPINGTLSEWIDGRILAEKLLSLLQNGPRLQEMGRRSRSFLRSDALSKIEERIRGMKTEENPGILQSIENSGQETLPDNRALISLLEEAYRKRPRAYKPDRIITRPEDLEYLKNRASTLLIHPSWQERNLGIKLLGLLDAREKIPAMLSLFYSRKPASFIKRLLGGDFEQVGFIRRNIVTSLVRLNEVTPEVEKALLAGLEDPYYEVRTEAAKAAAFFGNRLSSPDDFISALLRLLRDPMMDVATAAAEALGKLGSEDNVLSSLLEMYDTRFWRIRAAVLRGILHLVERGKVTDLDTLSQKVPRFILTSTDFRPQFEIKSVYGRLMESVSREKEKRNAQ
jgi:UDP-N-acetylglucosamine--N-acetylmuramyl-(pentapeptide) pyrophosphoryl-undecaprenol N-acetylglucosamine transferase